MSKAESNEGRFGYIDALRGYAILLVIFVHSSQRIGGLPTYVYQIGDQGARGVQLFFIASAITLCFSWHRRDDGVAAFYTRRFFRIAPMFWLAILYFVLVQGLGPRGLEPDGIGFKHISLTAVFAHGFLASTFSSVVPGGWSIAVEMMFYAVFPILVILIKSWRSALIATLVALILAIVPYWLLQASAKTVQPQSWGLVYQVFSTLNFIHQLPVFLIGMAAYFIIQDKRKSVERRPLLLAAISFFPMILVLVAYYRFHIPWAEFGFHSSYALAFAGIAIILARMPNSIFINRYIKWIGKVSFSGYLWHLALYTIIPTNFSWLPPILNLILFFVVLTVATLMISSVTYRFVESPMVSFGNRLLNTIRLDHRANPTVTAS